jgi:hypothetical protein
MAPEQARGEPATPAADVFSLAATLAYALTGQAPYGEGPPDELLARAARSRVSPLPAQVPADLRKPLTAMLDPNPARRPTAAEAIGGPYGTDVFPALRARRMVRSSAPRQRPRLTALLAAVAAGVAVAAIAILPGALSRKAASASSPRVSGAGTGAGGAASSLPADPVDGTPLVDGQPILANLVPAVDVDTYSMVLQDHLAVFPFCTAEVDVSLTAPAGVSDRLRILAQGQVVASAVSSDGVAAIAGLPKPDCLPTHSGTYEVQVTSVTGYSTADYRLERTGSW